MAWERLRVWRRFRPATDFLDPDFVSRVSDGFGKGLRVARRGLEMVQAADSGKVLGWMGRRCLVEWVESVT